MFWGVIIEAGKKFCFTAEKNINISRAALDFQSIDDDEPVQVFFDFRGKLYLICTLNKNEWLQASVDLNIMAGETVSFTTIGSGLVHLTGSIMDCDNDGDNSNKSKIVEVSAEKKRQNIDATDVQQKKKQKIDGITFHLLNNAPTYKAYYDYNEMNDEAAADVLHSKEVNYEAKVALDKLQNEKKPDINVTDCSFDDIMPVKEERNEALNGNNKDETNYLRNFNINLSDTDTDENEFLSANDEVDKSKVASDKENVQIKADNVTNLTASLMDTSGDETSFLNDLDISLTDNESLVSETEEEVDDTESVSSEEDETETESDKESDTSSSNSIDLQTEKETDQTDGQHKLNTLAVTGVHTGCLEETGEKIDNNIQDNEVVETGETGNVTDEQQLNIINLLGNIDLTSIESLENSEIPIIYYIIIHPVQVENFQTNNVA